MYLLKYTNVDWISTEGPSNLLNTHGVIIPIGNTGGSFKVWDHLAEAKNAFPKLRMAQIESHQLSAVVQGGSHSSPSPFILGYLKVSFPNDVVFIVTGG